jgi:hypothetical protein
MTLVITQSSNHPIIQSPTTIAQSPNLPINQSSRMPFKSQAQRRKFAELLVKGEISPETYEEWNRETGSQRLPERVTRKTKKAQGRRTAKKAKTAGRATKRSGRARKAKKR